MAYKLDRSNIEVSDSELIFGTIKLLPDDQDIPDEFCRPGGSSDNTYVKLFNDAFFSGLNDLNFDVAEGFEEIDKGTIWRCISAHMKSFKPKHEHKTTGVAYMMSLMMKNPVWTKKEKNKMNNHNI